MNEKSIPSPAEWGGGTEQFVLLMKVFYDKVLNDPLLQPVFQHISPEHAEHVAHFILEVLMGPKLYSQEFGQNSLHRMVGKHIGKRLNEDQRKRWVDLLVASADEIALPDDPEFRSTFIAHLEWGSRIAVMNSNLDINPSTPEDQIPTWGWGEVKGPYKVVGSLFRSGTKTQS